MTTTRNSNDAEVKISQVRNPSHPANAVFVSGNLKLGEIKI
jgi:hypothetical protein